MVGHEGLLSVVFAIAFFPSHFINGAHSHTQIVH